MDMETFKGLVEKAKGFSPFTIVKSRADKYVDNVWLLLIKFEDGELGLCIYNTEEEYFIEEPGNLEQYETTEQEILDRYWPE